MNKTWKGLVQFARDLGAGGLLYCGLELLWRGRTHISMGILGGFCLLGILRINQVCARFPLPGRVFLCAGFVTAAELCAGVWLNLRLGLAIWDYSDQLLNLRGQICPLFSLFWALLCLPICAWHDAGNEKMLTSASKAGNALSAP